MTERAECSNCDKFDYCNVAEFEAPETCGKYEGEGIIMDFNEDQEYYDDPMNNDEDFEIMEQMP